MSSDSDKHINHHLLYDKGGGKEVLSNKLVLGQLHIHTDSYFTTQKSVRMVCRAKCDK